MLIRICIMGLLISSLFCYLEWADQSAFLYEVEYTLLFRSKDSLQSLVHPLIFMPMIGQVMLIIALFRKQQNFKWLLIAILCIGLLVLMIFLVGILAWNFKIIMAALPFLMLSVLTLIIVRRKRLVEITGQ
jgi:hypothetical protein